MALFTAKCYDSVWTVAIRSGRMRATSIFSSPMPAHNCQSPTLVFCESLFEASR
jgi:hypothetical protein